MRKSHLFLLSVFLSLWILMTGNQACGAQGEFRRFLDCFKALEEFVPGSPSLGCLSGEPPIAGIGLTTRFLQQKEQQGFYVITDKTAYFVPETLPESRPGATLNQIYRLHIPGRKPTLFAQVSKELISFADPTVSTDGISGLSTVPKETHVLDVDCG